MIPSHLASALISQVNFMWRSDLNLSHVIFFKSSKDLPSSPKWNLKPIQNHLKPSTWWFKVTFLGWLSDPLKGLFVTSNDRGSLGKRKIIFKIDFSGHMLVPRRVIMEVWFRSFSFLFMGDGCRFQGTVNLPAVKCARLSTGWSAHFARSPIVLMNINTLHPRFQTACGNSLGCHPHATKKSSIPSYFYWSKKSEKFLYCTINIRIVEGTKSSTKTNQPMYLLFVAHMQCTNHDHVRSVCALKSPPSHSWIIMFQHNALWRANETDRNLGWWKVLQARRVISLTSKWWANGLFREPISGPFFNNSQSWLGVILGGFPKMKPWSWVFGQLNNPWLSLYFLPQLSAPTEIGHGFPEQILTQQRSPGIHSATVLVLS